MYGSLVVVLDTTMNANQLGCRLARQLSSQLSSQLGVKGLFVAFWLRNVKGLPAYKNYKHGTHYIPNRALSKVR